MNPLRIFRALVADAFENFAAACDTYLADRVNGPDDE